MRFYTQNDLINHWEGGKSYKQETDNGTETIISDQVRTLPYVTQKYFEVKALYDKGLKHENIKKKMGAVAEDGSPKLDARYKVVLNGGRTEELQGVFLHSFIDDCISLWENPLV